MKENVQLVFFLYLELSLTVDPLDLPHERYNFFRTQHPYLSSFLVSVSCSGRPIFMLADLSWPIPWACEHHHY